MAGGIPGRRALRWGVLVMVMAVAGCGRSGPDRLPTRPDGGPSTLSGTQPRRTADFDVSYCGDLICDVPVESFFTCSRDCRPRPSGEEPMIPDPGWVDPLPRGDQPQDGFRPP